MAFRFRTVCRRFDNSAAAFEHLVTTYGTPEAGSPAMGTADPNHAPADEILGKSRPVGAAPDIGAYEFVPSLTLSAASGDQTIRLTWTVNTTVPATTTWQIDYTGPIGDQSPPIGANRRYRQIQSGPTVSPH